MKANALFVFVLTCLIGCAAIVPEEADVQPAEPVLTHFPGVSGIARLEGTTYLIVQDAKVYEPEKNRIGIVEVDTETKSLSFKPLAFPRTASSLSNDLESVCRLPGRGAEFLLAESGYWEQEYGRLFHVSISGNLVELKRELKLPLVRDNNENQLDGDQFEGIACISSGEGNVIVLIGERGGTSVYPAGVLRWGTYDLDGGIINWSVKELIVKAPNSWKEAGLRSITGLTVDNQNRLWASAAFDAGDLGPFRSHVYLVGRISGNSETPVDLATEQNVRVINGFKVEGLASDKDGKLSIGTEDEGLGGAWRRLPGS